MVAQGWRHSSQLRRVSFPWGTCHDTPGSRKQQQQQRRHRAAGTIEQSLLCLSFGASCANEDRPGGGTNDGNHGAAKRICGGSLTHLPVTSRNN